MPRSTETSGINTASEGTRATVGEDLRIDGGITRGPEVEIMVDGHAVRAFEGESVAMALLAAGRRALRTTARRGELRGLYCGIGVCFECVMTVDGNPGVRTCQTMVRAGMRIDSQAGTGTWRVEA